MGSDIMIGKGIFSFRETDVVIYKEIVYNEIITKELLDRGTVDESELIQTRFYPKTIFNFIVKIKSSTVKCHCSVGEKITFRNDIFSKF